jgi:hypothetical protein
LLPFGQSDYSQTVWCFYILVEPLNIYLFIYFDLSLYCFLALPKFIFW